MDKFFPDIGNNFIVDPFCGAQSKYGLPDPDPANVVYYIQGVFKIALFDLDYCISYT